MMDDNTNAETGKRKSPENSDLDQLSELVPAQKLTACGLRSSTRLLNKQKTKPEDVVASTSGSVPEVQCKCNLSSCESCSRVASGHEALFAGKKRDFWTIQEQQDFFDGLKLYGKDFHSINVHMKSVAKRRARLITTASSNLNSDSASQAATAKIKTKEQLRHFYYRKLQLCQRFVGNYSSSNLPSQPRDLREVYLLLCYDALKKIFRDKLDPRLARPDFAFHLNQMITSGSTVVRVGRKGRFRAKAPACQALRSWNYAPTADGRGSGSGDPVEGDAGASVLPSGSATDAKGLPLTNLPSVVVVELIPLNNFSWSFVQSVAHNPRIAISAAPATKLDELRLLLEEKWRPRMGPLEAIQEQVANVEKISVSFHIPGNTVRQNLGEATVASQAPLSAENVTQEAADIQKPNGIPPENLLQMSLIELFLLMEKDSGVKDNSIRLEYSVQQTSEGAKALLSPALYKLLYLSSIRMKLLSQQQSSANASNMAAGGRLLSPSSSKLPYLPRIDEEGQNAAEILNADFRRPPNAITPRRRGGQRKTGPAFSQAPNVAQQAATQQQQQIPLVPVGGTAPNLPSSNAVAVNFIEQLKELRGKSQRKNRTAVVVDPGQPASEQHSPRILQQRRLMPKPVPVGIVESQMRFQAMHQNTFKPPPSFYSGGSNNNNQVVTSSLDPSVNIVITPLQTQSSSSQNFHFIDTNTQGSQQQQLSGTTSGYVSTFGDASLDISLPGESTLVELLNPGMKPSYSTPSATNLNSGSEMRSDNRATNVLDLGSMSIVSGRPISPTATAGFDISFGDPSLGAYLGSDVVGSANSLVNKNNSLAPWMMQESSMQSFFESNGPGAFDESSFLLPATSSNNQAQQPHNTRQNVM